MATNIFLGDPPTPIKQWIINHTEPEQPSFNDWLLQTYTIDPDELKSTIDLVYNYGLQYYRGTILHPDQQTGYVFVLKQNYSDYSWEYTVYQADGSATPFKAIDASLIQGGTIAPTSIGPIEEPDLGLKFVMTRTVDNNENVA